jgi:2-isopropylmalate synthase
MFADPSAKYTKQYQRVALPDRQWPDREIEKAPTWSSVDLRDGNQALPSPMSVVQKRNYFDMLKQIGFKDIEIGFPSASQPDFDFVRSLADSHAIPDDMRVGVLSQMNEDQISRTIESVRGIKNPTIHLYLGTSEQFRKIVLHKTKKEIVEMVLAGVEMVRRKTADMKGQNWGLEFSPEHFTQSDMKDVVKICNEVVKAWRPTKDRPLIINLPATVEVCTPNVYADMIEWFCRHVENRENVVVSVHPHNDRGTGVAAAEMAMLAGADRVEGCLFGGGERTGNADPMILALNMYVQGVAPNLDFSKMEEIISTYEDCTGMKVPPRYPYAGELVSMAFSGSHQDAVNKALAALQGEKWDVPYIPMDPNDIGRSRDGIIGVNSQSGKGGVAFVMEQNFGLKLPKEIQKDFAQIVQPATEEKGGVLSPKQLWDLFEATYLNDPSAAIRYVSHEICGKDKSQKVDLTLQVGEQEVRISGTGNGVVEATIDAFKGKVDVDFFQQNAMGTGTNAKAAAFASLAVKTDEESVFGVGIDEDTAAAPIKAVISGVNRAVKKGRLTLVDLGL